MRRPMRLSLAALVLLLVVLGAYTAYWLIVVQKIKNGFAAWAQAERAEKVDVSWQAIDVTGFPFACRIVLDAVVLRDDRVTPAPELRIPVVAGETRPWDFARWRLVAPEGLSAPLARAGERPAGRLSPRTAPEALTPAPPATATPPVRAQ